jgi:hypothetical protein
MFGNKRTLRGALKLEVSKPEFSSTHIYRAIPEARHCARRRGGIRNITEARRHLVSRARTTPEHQHLENSSLHIQFATQHSLYMLKTGPAAIQPLLIFVVLCIGVHRVLDMEYNHSSFIFNITSDLRFQLSNFKIAQIIC